MTMASLFTNTGNTPFSGSLRSIVEGKGNIGLAVELNEFCIYISFQLQYFQYMNIPPEKMLSSAVF